MQVQYDQPVWNIKRAYYTAMKLDGSTAITDTILDGYVMCHDLTNQVQTQVGASTKNVTGVAVTKPEDGADGDNTPYFAGVVVDTKTGFKGPGDVWIIQCADALETFVGVNVTTDPLVYLMPVSGQWYLGETMTAIGGTGSTAARSVLRLVSKTCAHPLVTDATLTATPANIKVCLGGGYGG